MIRRKPEHVINLSNDVLGFFANGFAKNPNPTGMSNLPSAHTGKYGKLIPQVHKIKLLLVHDDNRGDIIGRHPVELRVPRNRGANWDVPVGHWECWVWRVCDCGS